MQTKKDPISVDAFHFDRVSPDANHNKISK